MFIVYYPYIIFCIFYACITISKFPKLRSQEPYIQSRVSCSSVKLEAFNIGRAFDTNIRTLTARRQRHRCSNWRYHILPSLTGTCQSLSHCTYPM